MRRVRLLLLILLAWAMPAPAEVDPAVVAQHAHALMSDDSNERITAVVELERLGADAEPALPAMKAAMNREQDPGIKGLMIRAIASIEAAPREQPRPTDIPGHAERVHALTHESVHGETLDQQKAAMKRLAELGAIARPALGDLHVLQGLGHESWAGPAQNARKQITATLWFIEGGDAEHENARSELTVDAYRVVITQTMWALAGKLADDDAKVRIRAIRDIAKFRAAAQPALPTLARIAESDADAVARKLAGRAIAKIEADIATTRELRDAEK